MGDEKVLTLNKIYEVTHFNYGVGYISSFIGDDGKEIIFDDDLSFVSLNEWRVNKIEKIIK